MPAEPVQSYPDSSQPDPMPHSGAERPLRLPAAHLASLAAALSVPDGGFTIDPATGAAVGDGYAVSVDPFYERTHDRPITARDLAAYLTTAQRALRLPRRVLGGWRDPESGRVHLDVSVVVPTLAEALELGRSAGQIAVFDLAAGKSTPVPDQDSAVVIPLRKTSGTSGEIRPESVTSDTGWRYDQKRRGKPDRSFSGTVTHVGEAEGERIRGDLAAALAELLTWAGEQDGQPSRDERKAA
ncbi:hypothetical protein SK803_01255 [Lentzea sp. BCCO 10_0856]|uniref:ESAT-6 protein secretion system EspG family protein n=1 Tax=Lentzea miocenica TaxID=3095431 RepID=A0ABU4SSL4_9PSEU|nr:hypothetical protein [Lentzea sp. BCCO 10_0856]MDX8028812.1 hypothetical protein [Lentzea sp. BCCO 10_0856]